MKQKTQILFLLLIFLLPALCQAQNLPWLKVEGTKIINENGQAVLLRGINLSNNVWGNWVEGVSEKLEIDGADPLIRPVQQDEWVLTDADFARLKKLGPKVVRYAINYELFAKDNKLRKANLERLKKQIDKFDELGIYVIVSLHLPQGLEVQNDNYERDKPGTERIQSIFENEEYWKNTIAMWQYLAENLKNMPAVAGYSLFNEPRLPSEADGGIKKYQRKHNELIKAICQVDDRHIIFVPEYNSRERSDDEQSVVWDKGFVKVDDNNVVYVFSFYDPYEYTHLNSPNFDKNQLKNIIKEKIDWTERVGAPILICEYGVTRNQSLKNRLRYLKFIHKFANEYKIPAIYWEYKSIVGAFSKPINICGLYGEHLKRDEQIIKLKAGYRYQNWAQEAVKANKFDPIYRKYFWKSKTNVSLMDNQPIWQELHNFYK